MSNDTGLEVFVSVYAEISKEYISRFPEQECVQHYLKTVSEKAGAELISHCNDTKELKDKTFTVKGPWLSVSRARQFLQKFLATFDGSATQTVTSTTETECSDSIEGHQNNNDVDFQENTSSSIKSNVTLSIPKPIIMYDGLENEDITENHYRQSSLTKIGSAFKNAYQSKNKPNTVQVQPGTDSNISESEVKKEEMSIVKMTVGDDIADISDDLNENGHSSDSDYIPVKDTESKLPKSKKEVNDTNTRSLRKRTSLQVTPKTKLNKRKVKKNTSSISKTKVTNSNDSKSVNFSKLSKKQISPSKIEDSDSEYQCYECPYMAKKKAGLREHKRRAHRTKDFACSVCDKVFGFGKDLNRHMKSHQKPQNCCDICGKLYKGIRSLAEHRKTHDDGYEKPEFQCDICRKSFSTKYVLAYHIKSDHLGMKRSYLCPTCGKSFSQKHSYIQHANVHLGIRPHKCELCDKSFAYEKSLKEHKFMHDNIRRFKCDKCDKGFRQSSALAIHARIHKETKDYVCSSCGRGFSQKQALKRHERIHLGEKPFVCGLCTRNFTDASVLRRHMILIHKKEPKKWREDTLSLVKRAQYFIDVMDKTSGGTENETEMIVPDVDEEHKSLRDHNTEVNEESQEVNSANTEAISPHNSLSVSQEQVYQQDTNTPLSIPSIAGMSTESHMSHPSYNPVPMYSNIGIFNNHDHYMQSQPVNLHTLENLQSAQHPQYYSPNFPIQSTKLYEPEEPN